jgi:hypothetical protein
MTNHDENLNAEPRPMDDECFTAIYSVGLMPGFILSSETIRKAREAERRHQENKDKKRKPPKPPSRPNAKIGHQALAGYS